MGEGESLCRDNTSVNVWLLLLTVDRRLACVGSESIQRDIEE